SGLRLRGAQEQGCGTFDKSNTWQIRAIRGNSKSTPDLLFTHEHSLTFSGEVAYWTSIWAADLNSRLRSMAPVSIHPTRADLTSSAAELVDATASRRYFARNSRAFSTNCAWNWQSPPW